MVRQGKEDTERDEEVWSGVGHIGMVSGFERMTWKIESGQKWDTWNWDFSEFSN